MNYDIAVIGGGAAGLTAAIAAARNENVSVAVIERLPRVGKKILATGNGRCNLSNTAVKQYKYNTSFSFAVKITESFDAVDFFGGLGLFCRNDNEGRVYPYSNLATSVLDALRLACGKYGVTEICDFEVTDIKPKGDGYEIISRDSHLRAKKVIIACGGYSSPAFGTDGSMLRLLRSKGINITKLTPALCPVMTDGTRSLKGIRAKAAVRLCDKSGKAISRSRGEIIFNENNISGICIFDISADAKEGMRLELDLAPEYSGEKLREEFIRLTDIRRGLPADDVFTGFFPKRLVQYLLKRVGKCACNDTDISSDVAIALADRVKALGFTVKSGASWKESQVTRGGIDGKELKDTLELKKMRGVYVAGEIIDIDGICGGYNLNWAWASGACAGKNAAE